MQNRWNGEFNHWPLAEALSWRMEFGGTLGNAFTELAVLLEAPEDCRVVANGFAYKHACEGNEIVPWRRWIDPPTSHDPTKFGLATMPRGEWSNLMPQTNEAGQVTSDLKCKTCRLIAWGGVEFLDRYTLVNAWLQKFGLAESLPEHSTANARAGIRTNHEANAETAAGEWIAARGREWREHGGKRLQKNEALKQVTDVVADRGALSDKAFERAWAGNAPSEWRKAGRPSKGEKSPPPEI
jgi:hypothetical protein